MSLFKFILSVYQRKSYILPKLFASDLLIYPGIGMDKICCGHATLMRSVFFSLF